MAAVVGEILRLEKFEIVAAYSFQCDVSTPKGSY